MMLYEDTLLITNDNMIAIIDKYTIISIYTHIVRPPFTTA